MIFLFVMGIISLCECRVLEFVVVYFLVDILGDKVEVIFEKVLVLLMVDLFVVFVLFEGGGLVQWG